MLASELSLAGVQPIVLEQAGEASEYSRSLTLHARSVEVFGQRGLDWFRDYPRVQSYNFGLLQLQHLIDESLIPLLVPQRHVERLLEDRATGMGADVRRGHEVIDAQQDRDGVTVIVRGPDGEYQLRASYLVGCDGGASRVRKLAGIGFPGTASSANGLTADVITDPEVKERIAPTLHQAGLFAVIPLQPGLFRVTTIEFGVEQTGKDVEPTLEEFRASIKRVAGVDLPLLDQAEVRWLSRFGNATRLADSYRAGRIFLAGDSAHIHLPVSGQGLNTGIQDAVNLGWKLAAEIHGWAPEGLLDTYESERRPIGERVCMNTRAQDALMHPLDRVGPLRELMAELLRLPAVCQYVTDMVTGVGITYPVSYPGREDAHPLLGRRLPAFVTEDGATGTSLLASGRAVLFTAQESVTAEGWADRVDVVRIGAVPELDAAVVLVRPDGHVIFTDRAGADSEGLRLALKTWFGEPKTA
jgi:bifunctional hydroxylase/dehydrase